MACVCMVVPAFFFSVLYYMSVGNAKHKENKGQEDLKEGIICVTRMANNP